VTSRYSSIIEGARDRKGNDPIFALNAEARRRAEAGESILNATLGALMTDDGRLCTLPTVLETMARFQTAQSAGYAPISGVPAFRNAVIRDLFDDGPLAAQAVAVATPGGTGAVYEAVVNFLEPGQRLLVPEFYWGPYTEISRHTGRALDPFPMFRSDGTFNVDAMAAGLERHLATQGRCLVVLNFPCHNPTGYSLDAEEWLRVAEAVDDVGKRGPVGVLIDAAYMEFGGPAARRWLSSIPSLVANATVLVAWTASKSFAQYGARVGALVGLHRDPDEVAQMDNALGYSCRATWSNCNHLGQLAVAELLTDSELRERVDAERAEIQALLQDRVDAFNEHATAARLPTPRYDAGFFVAVFTPDEQASAAKMRELGVYVVPIPGAVRVAMCSTPAAAVPRLVAALEAGIGAVR
jgi:aromatic-amino-acid transaminase